MNFRRNIFVIIALILVCALATPYEAQARGFFREMFKGVRKVTTFIVQTPAKIVKGVTRPLGPVIGPIASEILLAQLPSNIVRIVDKAGRVQAVANDIKNDQAKIDAGRKIIQQRRQQLSETRVKLDSLKSSFSQGLIAGSMTFQQYKDKVAQLEHIKNAMTEVESKLSQAEKNLRPENLARLLARDALRRLPGQLEGVVFRQIDAEVSKLINPEIIERIINKKPLKPEEIIDLVLDGDIKKFLRDKSLAGDKVFMERLKKELKDTLKKDADLLKGNWQELLEKKINEIASGNSQEASGGEGEVDNAGQTEVKSEENKTGSEEDTGDAIKLANYFGDSICLISDPKFWDSMFEGLFEGKKQSQVTKEDQQKVFLREHGYTSEEEAKADMVKYWGKDSFKTAVKSRVQTRCPAALNNEKLKLDQILNTSLPAQ